MYTEGSSGWLTPLALMLHGLHFHLFLDCNHRNKTMLCHCSHFGVIFCNILQTPQKEINTKNESFMTETSLEHGITIPRGDYHVSAHEAENA